MRRKQIVRFGVLLGILMMLGISSGIIYAAPGPYSGKNITTMTLPIFTVSKSASHNPAPADVLTYSIVINNGGTAVLNGVAISDTLPANTTFVPGSVTITPPDGGATTGTPPALVSGMTVATNTAVTVSFAVTVDSPLAAGTSIANTAAVTATNYSTPTLASKTVTVQNVAPVASKTITQTAEDTPLNGTAIATDGNGDGLTFSISSPPSHGTATMDAAGNYIYTPTLNYNGSDSFHFTATDGISTSNSGEVSITITAVNDPPAFDPIGTKTVDEGSPLNFSAHATDPDSSITGMAFSNVPAGASIGSGGADTLTFNWTPTEAQGPGTYYPQVWATDGSLTTTVTITITVNEVNIAPVLAAIGNKTVDELSPLNFTISATDADLPANGLSYSMQNAPGGATLGGSSGAFSWTPTEAQGPGSYPVTFIVADDGSPVMTDSETITITVNEVNTAPVLAAIGNKTVDVNNALNFTASATDGDTPANALTFSLGAGAPSGASISTGGNFSWTPSVAQAPGVYPVTIIVADDGTPVMTDSETISITVIDVADLKVTKNGPASAIAGSSSPVVYSLVVDNFGPSLASSVRMTDTLPGGVSFVSADPSGAGSCSKIGNSIICDWPSIPSGNLETAVIQVTVDADTTANLNNTAIATSAVTDRTPSNNSDSAVTTVNTSADLQVSQTDSADPVYIGDALVYTAIVTNAGPSVATGVTLADVLHNSLTIDSVSAGCTPSGQTVNCTLGTLAVGASKIITVAVTPTADGTVDAVASVSSAVSDPTSGNNSATENTTIQPYADLGLSKTAAPNPIAAGETLTYTLVVSNFGPSAAQSVTLTDSVPTTATLKSVSSTQGSCSGTATITCNLGTLTANGIATVTITVTPTQLGTLNNSASVAAASPTDRNSANNSASETVNVTLKTDVGLAMTAAPDTVVAGETLTFTIPVTNFGPSTAGSVTVLDSLPAGLSFAGGSAGCSATGQDVTCGAGTLTAGSSTVVTIVANVSSAITATIVNTATVSAFEFDPVDSNNTASTSTPVSTRADVQIGQSDSPDPVNATGTVIYTLSITNGGPSDAQSVVLTDTLPAGFTPTTAAGCSISGQDVTCTIGTLAAGNTAMRQISALVDVNLTGTFVNSAGVTSTTADPNLANNSTGETTTVNPAVDVSVSLADAADPITAGETVSYTMTVRNLGTHTANGTQATLTLPAETTFQSATGGCSHSAGTVTCNIGALAAGNSAERTITAVVNSAATGSISANASVTATEFDPATGNNSATEATALTTEADLSLGLVAPASAQINRTVTLTFTVANAGPSAAASATLSATMPAGFTVDSISPSQGNCTGSSSIVCTLGNIDTGTAATIAVQGHATITGTLQPFGNVGSATTDPVSDNETALANIDVTMNTIFLPLVLKPLPPVQLSIFNDNTGGNVYFEVIGTGVSCTVPNNTTQFCGEFEPGTYQIKVVSACGSATVPKTYNRGPVTTRVFCN